MQTFTYKPSFSFSFIFFLIAGLAAIYFGLTSNFSLGFRRVSLLEPPYSGYVITGLGFITVLVSIYSLFKWLSNRGNKGEIQVSEEGLAFPEYSVKGSKQSAFKFTDVTELYQKSDDDGFSIIVYTANNDRFEFDSTYFDSEQSYNDFASLMDQYCGK